METLLGIAAVTTLISALGFALGRIYEWRLGRTERNELSHYRETYLFKSGWTAYYRDEGLDYDLRSFDGGRNWYAVERAMNGEIKVLGLTDEVYPGLLKRLEGINGLVNYVSKYGVIGLNNIHGIEHLEKAGFTMVKEKDS